MKLPPCEGCTRVSGARWLDGHWLCNTCWDVAAHGLEMERWTKPYEDKALEAATLLQSLASMITGTRSESTRRKLGSYPQRSRPSE